ncbi:glycosyltransferase like family 2-domain-containing protein [Cercophora newfieldiana]|uniref:Glycosyltransferase like family 2-domain-containing protein n=1 Tax=Cercophora newfieldiana TaxID=92897 RepID=A0AA39YV15_9PEZI|nr:glycosyltransferase like family 2-domain-containing protein [Cercophora newfieldiana]
MSGRYHTSWQCLSRQVNNGLAPNIFTKKKAIGNALALMQIAFFTHLAISYFSRGDSALYYFLMLFAWRYARFLINVVGFFLYTPAALAANQSPTYKPSSDVTVILPTVDPEGEHFFESVVTCALNNPAEMIVVTAGNVLYGKTRVIIDSIRSRFPAVRFVVSRTQIASKREQIAHAIPLVRTRITVLLDDHVFWKPTFLASLLLPFEDSEVGIVGTNKAVRRIPGLGVWGRFWNHLGAVYLIRHNFEIRSSNAIDGGVFVVSARTCALRTPIMQDPAFIAGYTNEKFLFGMVGPLNSSDDNFCTRWCVTHNWKIKIQYTPDAEIETVVGATAPIMGKFLGQCRRWARTTWRSNSASLFSDRTIWAVQPYCVYAVFLTSFTNFALITDPALVYLLRSSDYFGSSSVATKALVAWILFTKIIKVAPYYWKHPQDVWMFPGYLAYAYAHSFIKFWALVTFWDCKWSGRNLDAIKVDPTNSDETPVEIEDKN